MRKCHYGILAAVFLCTWKAEETFANDQYLQLFKPFILYQDADCLHHRLNTSPWLTKELSDEALEYARNNRQRYVHEHHIMQQYIFMENFNQHNFVNDPQLNAKINRKFIMLNAYLTFEAYEAAVIFRVCAFYYSHVIKVEEKEKACMHLSLYMEWYFSFKLKEKADDLCRIKEYFTPEENTSLGSVKAENICKILKKLNLDFLRFPGDEKFIPLPQNDDNNVFDFMYLTTVDTDGEKHFVSAFDSFQKYVIDQPIESNNSDSLFNQLWKYVMAAYSGNYYELLRYFSEVTTGLPKVQISSLDLLSKFSESMWDNAPHYEHIRNLSVKNPRGVVLSYTNEGKIGSYSGSKLFRNAAVEILRQMLYFSVSPTFDNNPYLNGIMETVNSSTQQKCYLLSASLWQNLSVDYVFYINTNHVMPFFLQ